MFRKLMFVVVLLMVFCIADAEMISGRVISAKDLRGVEDAMIWLDGSNAKTVTNNEGLFFFKNVKPGSYVLRVKHIAFQDYSQKVDVPVDDVLLIQLGRMVHQISGASVSDTRAQERKTPVAVTNLGSSEIRSKLQGQDLPLILDDIPGVTSYSESGSGSGYSYMKARGFDQKRIGVMINGIPLNDPEDHRVYWVDMPDFSESVQDIQFQHGVGASRYGIASFGGSLNIQTVSAENEHYNQLFYQAGSYNTHKYGIQYNSELRRGLDLNIRLSKITSDGYRDNSASELQSLYGSITYKGLQSVSQFNYFTGHEKTHAAWDASWEEDLNDNHQHNPIEYDNEIDDFEQPHIEFHNFFSINNKTQLKNSLFYIKGKGFYEQLKYDRDLWEYGLAEEADVQYADIIRQKWVEKNHYGWITSLSHEHLKGEFACGTYLSYFNSDHWGEVDDILTGDIPAEFSNSFKYHQYQGEKKYLTAYANENYRIMKDINLQANLHYQYITYDFDQKEAGNFTGEYLNSYSVDYSFFNPQVGVNYNLNKKWNVFASTAIAHREPADNELYDIWDGPDDLGVKPLFEDFHIQYDDDGNISGYEWENPLVDPEYVIDYELGAGYTDDKINWRVNAYYMDFKNEIVDFGGVDDEGYSIRGNADATVHQGIETMIRLLLPLRFNFAASYSFSDNYFKDFTYDYYGTEMDLTGNQLAGFPQHSGQWKLSRDMSFSKLFIQMKYTGKQFLDNTESEEHIIDEYNVWNLGCDLDLPKILGRTNLSLQFRMNNVFDLEYETAGYLDEGDGDYDYNDNFYYPAAGRNYSLALRAKF